MKILNTIGTSGLVSATVMTILIGEVITWVVAGHFGARSNPVVVAALCLPLLVAFALVLYHPDEVN
ncbi:MAG: hypothetical protein ABIZ04_00430 [Opitutus sp.]